MEASCSWLLIAVPSLPTEYDTLGASSAPAWRSRACAAETSRSVARSAGLLLFARARHESSESPSLNAVRGWIPACTPEISMNTKKAGHRGRLLGRNMWVTNELLLCARCRLGHERSARAGHQALRSFKRRISCGGCCRGSARGLCCAWCRPGANHGSHHAWRRHLPWPRGWSRRGRRTGPRCSKRAAPP